MAQPPDESDFAITSPLVRWPGVIRLPHPDEFNGEHWAAWRAAVDAQPETVISRLYCYAGLAFVEKCGTWALSVPLAEVAGWQHDPAAERIKLVSWLGREMQKYFEQVTNPKN